MQRRAVLLAGAGLAGLWLLVALAWQQEPPEYTAVVPPPAPTRCVERWAQRPEVQPYEECWSATIRGNKRAAEVRYGGPH